MSESTEQLLSEGIRQEVKVVNVAMPFGSMVIFMVKWAIASVPAILILVTLLLLALDAMPFYAALLQKLF